MEDYDYFINGIYIKLNKGYYADIKIVVYNKVLHNNMPIFSMYSNYDKLKSIVQDMNDVSLYDEDEGLGYIDVRLRYGNEKNLQNIIMKLKLKN